MGASNSRRQASPETVPEDTEPMQPDHASHKKRRSHASQQASAAKVEYDDTRKVYQIQRSQVVEERAQRLGSKYGLSVKPWDWEMVSPDDMVLRTDGETRMRVRFQCHKCQKALPSSKQCAACHHKRCSKCPRDPPKETEEEAEARRARRSEKKLKFYDQAPIIADYRWDDPGYILKRPSKNGGQDLIHKDSRQRVRRTCHECNAVFAASSKMCDKCGHVRCTDCPRDPAKKHKYPFGYPGDEFGPSSVPRYQCINCTTLYAVDATNDTLCQRCGTQKSIESPRALPRAVDAQPDPELLRSIQQKLDELHTS